MLLIRDAQKAALLEPRRELYIREMLLLVRGRYPRTLADVPDGQLSVRIGAGLDAAPRYAFETSDDIGMFVEATALLGPGFERADWAVSLLAGTNRHRAARLLEDGRLAVDLDE